MLETRFTRLVDCTAPLQLAPMGSMITPELVAAVTGAGGMAMLSYPMAPVKAMVAALEAVTPLARGPLGVNFLVPVLEDPAAVEEAASRVKLVDFYHAPPDPALVERAHAPGGLAGWQIGSVEEAKRARDSGCDLVVVRGIEGGGRMYGRRSLWPLLFEVLDAVGDAVPVVAAGGIATGRGLAAALAAGADGARMGTRFIATEESGAHPRYKELVVSAQADETVLTEAFAKMWPDPWLWSRVLVRALESAEASKDEEVGEVTIAGEPMAIPRFGVPPPSRATTGNIDAMALYAGESVGAITQLEKAADVVRGVVGEATGLLAARRV